jgi:hypothetical protein
MEAQGGGSGSGRSSPQLNEKPGSLTTKEDIALALIFADFLACQCVYVRSCTSNFLDVCFLNHGAIVWVDLLIHMSVLVFS